MKYLSSSVKDTINLGKKIASTLMGGEVFGLVGELGVGKTVFVKGLAKGLGIKTTITSPTFVLMKVYEVNNKTNIKRLVHVDAYRLKDIKHWSQVGLEEYLADKKSVVIIEWAEQIKKLLPVKTCFINLQHLSAETRQIIISTYGQTRKSNKNNKRNRYGSF